MTLPFGFNPAHAMFRNTKPSFGSNGLPFPIPSDEDIKDFAETTVFPMFKDLFEKFTNEGGGEEPEEPEDTDEVKDGSRTITIDLPGYGKKNINVDYDKRNSTITVSAVRNTPGRENEYKRKFSVPEGLTEDLIKSEYVDGVLTVTIENIPDETVHIKIS